MNKMHLALIDAMTDVAAEICTLSEQLYSRITKFSEAAVIIADELRKESETEEFQPESKGLRGDSQ